MLITEEKRKHLLRKLELLDKSFCKISDMHLECLRKRLSRFKDVEQKRDAILLFKSIQRELIRKKKDKERRIRCELLVEDIAVYARNFDQLFGEYMQMQRKNVVIKTKQEELKLRLKYLRRCWNEFIMLIEAENREVCEAILISGKQALITKVKNAMAIFRTIAKIYSEMIANELKRGSYKSSELAMSIALVELLNRRVLSTVLGRSEGDEQ